MDTGPIMKLGRYEVKEKIAAGGMATVYRAVQTGVGGFRSVVALKTLHPHLAGDGQFKKMFMEEARIGALLSHRSLMKVLDFGEEEGVSFLVTEYFPSLTLEDLSAAVGKVPLAPLLFILAEVAEGLEALHQARDLDGERQLGLVHRDISPHNILVGRDGRVKLIDYGIVKRADPTERTRAGLVKGKVRYMAPEQACGGPVGPAADLYALGLVALRALTGERPHGSGNTAEILARARAGLELDKSLKRHKLPAALKELLASLLHTDANSRPASAAVVAAIARKLLAAENPGFDVSALQSWLDESGATTGKRRRKSAAARAAATPAPGAPPQGTGLVRLPASGEGLHPRWFFLGLSVLFATAVIAYLFELLLS